MLQTLSCCERKGEGGGKGAERSYISIEVDLSAETDRRLIKESIVTNRVKDRLSLSVQQSNKPALAELQTDCCFIETDVLDCHWKLSQSKLGSFFIQNFEKIVFGC